LQGICAAQPAVAADRLIEFFCRAVFVFVAFWNKIGFAAKLGGG